MPFSTAGSPAKNGMQRRGWTFLKPDIIPGRMGGSYLLILTTPAHPQMIPKAGMQRTGCRDGAGLLQGEVPLGAQGRFMTPDWSFMVHEGGKRRGIRPGGPIKALERPFKAPVDVLTFRALRRKSSGTGSQAGWLCGGRSSDGSGIGRLEELEYGSAICAPQPGAQAPGHRTACQ